jgi:cobalt-zinc-cadmium efflux system outer membrane protein
LVCTWRTPLWAQPNPAAQIGGVRRISLEDGLRLLEEANLELRLAREALAGAEARRVSSAEFPNPALSGVREELSGTLGSYSETVLTLSQVLEVGGQRGLRRTTAQRTVAAATAQLSAEHARVAFELHRAYVRAAQAEADLAAHTEAAAEFRRAEGAGRARFAEGDISRFETRRLQFERARHETLVAQARLGLSEVGRELAMLTDSVPPTGGGLVLPSESLEGMLARARSIGLDEALDFAAERAEVRAAEAQVEAARASLSLQLRERVPDLTLTGGYKHQTDGRAGAVIGLALPLPLWNRNGGGIALARSELEGALARRDLVRMRVDSEIRRAWEAYRSFRDRMELLATELMPGSEGLLETARVAYDLGEMSLIELLDAADIYRTSRETLNQLLADSLIAQFDLERAMGRLLESAVGAGSETSPGGEDR